MAYQALNPLEADVYLRTVQAILDDVNKRGSRCKRGTDILNTDFKFVQYSNMKKTRTTLGNKLYTRDEWNKYVRSRNREYICGDVATLRTQATAWQKCSSRNLPAEDDQRFEPIFVIEGSWGLKNRVAPEA